MPAIMRRYPKRWWICGNHPRGTLQTCCWTRLLLTFSIHTVEIHRGEEEEDVTHLIAFSVRKLHTSTMDPIASCSGFYPYPSLFLMSPTANLWIWIWIVVSMKTLWMWWMCAFFLNLSIESLHKFSKIIYRSRKPNPWWRVEASLFLRRRPACC
jgi:hypothetical protein